MAPDSDRRFDLCPSVKVPQKHLARGIPTQHFSLGFPFLPAVTQIGLPSLRNYPTDLRRLESCISTRVATLEPKSLLCRGTKGHGDFWERERATKPIRNNEISGHSNTRLVP